MSKLAVIYWNNWHSWFIDGRDAGRSEDWRLHLYNLIWGKKVSRALMYCILGTNKVYTEGCLQLRFVANYKQKTLLYQHDSKQWYTFSVFRLRPSIVGPEHQNIIITFHWPRPDTETVEWSDNHRVTRLSWAGLGCCQTKHKTQHYKVGKVDLVPGMGDRWSMKVF